MRICFIGHRLIDERKIRDRLEQTVEAEIKNGAKSFAMGTHGDFDKLALSTCRKLRKKYAHIDIEVVLTSLHKIEKCILYNDQYGLEYEVPYKDVTTTMYEIEDIHFKRQIIKSNQMMIDDCDILICYVDKKKYRSGAKLAMNYAIKKNKKIINIFKDSDVNLYRSK